MPFPKNLSKGQGRFNKPNFPIEHNLLRLNKDVFTVLRIFASEQNPRDVNSFLVTMLNIFQNYDISFTKEADYRRFKNGCDMSFWQNQLNFAVWCATSECGIGVRFHLTDYSDPSYLFDNHVPCILSNKTNIKSDEGSASY